MRDSYDKGQVDPDAGYVDAEEMPETERDLAEDAQWKVIQKNTFTRWANEHLKKADKHIADLQNDFSDGLRLIALIEVLAQHKFKSINKRPTFRTQKLENVTTVLRFLEDEEKIKLVNIDSSDIVDSRLKLILGLIWTLILHYSISLPLWEGEEELPIDSKGHGPTPKERIIKWINGKLPDKPIKNLTTDWNDGTAIGALVDACAPGLCPDWPDWEKKQALRNAKEAMDAAEQWLDVPQLIKPEEMINPKVDEKAMMTYLAQFPNATIKPGAPLRPRTNPARVRAYGPGLEKEGNTVGAPARFTIETFSAGRGNIEVVVLNPSGKVEPCEVHANNDKNLTYSCVYVPTCEGEYRVIIKFSSKEIPHSPYKVKVEGAAGDARKVTAQGPGVEPVGNLVGKRTHFFINVAGAGAGNVDCVVVDAKQRHDAVKPLITRQSADTYLVEYTPKEEGQHSVNVYFAGQLIPKSPFKVSVGPPSIPKAAYVTGRGVQPSGIRLNDPVDFFVHTENAGEGKVSISIIGPDNNEVPYTLAQLEPHLYKCSYVPQKVGKYAVTVLFANNHVQRSPFRVDVAPKLESKIRAYGPGLHYGICNRPAVFTVESNDETGSLGFSIEGPSEAAIECSDNGDGSAVVSYYPTLPGEYAIHITSNGEDINKSPFMANITNEKVGFDPSRVKAYGPGLESGKVKVSVTTEFTVDIRDAGGPAKVSVECFDCMGQPVPVELKDKGDGTFLCRYTVARPQKHTIYVSYGGINISSSPFMIDVSSEMMDSVGKVHVYGPGIESATKNHTAIFTVDCRKSGQGEVVVIVTDEKGNKIPAEIRSNHDDTYTVLYTPKTSGNYSVQVYFNKHEVLLKKVPVRADIDISKVRVENLEPRIFKESFSRFTVDAHPIDSVGKGNVKGIVTNPKGLRSACKVDNLGDGTYRCYYSPVEEGPHKVEVLYEGLPISNSPFPVEVVPGYDSSKVKAYGPGLESGVVNNPLPFKIDLAGAGKGGIGMAIEGPGDAEIKCVDNKDGTCSVEYTPVKAGTYDVFVKFNDEDIPGSPFRVPIQAVLDPSKVQCTGPALQPDKVRVGKPAVFTVDATQAGEAPLEVIVEDRTGKALTAPVKLEPHSHQPNVYHATFTPEMAGPHKIDVKYGGVSVPDSPFTTNVLPQCEPQKVKVSGEGVMPSEGVLKASLPVEFMVDAREAGDGDLELSLKDPEAVAQTMSIKDNNDGTFKVDYQPYGVGDHTVTVRYNETNVPGSPYKVPAVAIGKPEKCKIEEGLKPTVALNDECVITVNTAEAGPGKPMCRIVSPDNHLVDVDVEDNNNGTHSIYYTPKLLGTYDVDVRFGGKTIPSGAFRQKVVKPEDLAAELNGEMITPERSSGAQIPPSGFYPIDFKLPVGEDFDAVKGDITTPSGKHNQPKLVNNRDGTVTVQYQPDEKGLHELNLAYHDKPTQGSPFRFYVDNCATGGKVHAYGPGLSHGYTGEPADFTIVTKEAGAGGLTLAIEGPSKAEIDCHDNNDGTCSVSYVPRAPGNYSVILKFMDRHIPGSPFNAKISGEPKRRSQISIGATSDVSLKVSEADVTELTASVKAPSGVEEPCILKKMPNDHLGISFTPKETGDHLVNVYRSGQHIPNSPFKIHVAPNEIGNASKVKVYGDGIEKGMANDLNQFTVDTREAGFGGLSLSIEGPSKADIDCQDNHDGTCTVSYYPTEPGQYLINIKYADQHVPGSPFAVKIGGEATEMIREQILRQQEAAQVTHVGSQCELSLRIPGTNPMDMTASVTSPSGHTQVCDIVDVDDSHYSINFVPKEMGVHTVAVKHLGSHIPGSPFQFTVGPITDGGAHKVKATGPGLQRGTVNTANEFNILTREAGAGGLCIAIEGPSKAEIDFEDRKDGSCGVNYIVTEPGDYIASIKFNDEHIPESPFRIYISESLTDTITSVDAKKLNLGNTNKGFQIGRPAAFTVNYTSARGRLRAYVETPSGTQDEAIIQTVDTDQYAVRFIPRENGPHLIHVLNDDRPIPGSPFRFLVGQYDADPGMVHATGDGLKHGIVGEKNRFFVNTVNAGSGALNVTVDGPSKVQLNCHERENGYEFTYLPTEPGQYVITVKYGGNYHIVGSPFTAEVTGQSGTGSGPLTVDQQSHVLVETVDKTVVGKIKSKSDSHPERVNCYGLGLKMAHADKMNQFTVDASNAGMDILLVGIAGPERPCEEVVVKHIGRNQFTVSYNVMERGTHLLMVKWGDQHVPGSPFIVEVP